MVDNQHQKITGYRDLTEDEIGQMNQCKALAVKVGILCDLLADLKTCDGRWLAIGRTQLQQGFMAVIRSIAKPETF